MNRLNPIGYAVAILSASILLMNAPSASAQNANRQAAGQGQGQGQGRRGGGGGAAFANATEEQTAALREMNQEVRDVQRQVTEARAALNAAIYADKLDEAQIKEKAAAVAKLDAELAVARAKAFAKVRSKFTKEQIDSLKAGIGGGGGGRGAGRRQGGNNN